MRSYLLAASVLAGASLLAACEKKSSEPSADAGPDAPVDAPTVTEEAPQGPVDAFFSDELPGLSGPATGIAFWEHPSQSYNSLLIVANADGIVSYNMEDGTEVGRVDGVNAQGVAVSYFGFGASAAGFLATHDAAANAVRLYGIDNSSRTFLPLDGAPELTGEVRDICAGRAPNSSSPMIFAVQETSVRYFSLAANADGVSIAEDVTLETPDNLVSCAVDIKGALTLAADNGEIYRLDNEAAFLNPLAIVDDATPADVAVIQSQSGDDGAVSEQVLLLDQRTGAVHVFNRDDGEALGAINFSGTDQMPDAEPAVLMGSASANLGALYRDGILGFGAAGDEGPVVRIAPVSTVLNSLSLPVGGPVTARGMAMIKDNELNITLPDINNEGE
ncbi:hypothetical protein PUV54_13095 [Hyphococcus flavus]|uniref:BPP domain-containing protein n=1 Tax=Hyphococcus flavus TaxID=1866326 RepID=A0AAE9ZCF7_9PROT|nr:hypothetical protein [Hyphococcus flavus]WDI30890.1 hypothetical protein PUV54_13095 [Hyphococcus flavus]